VINITKGIYLFWDKKYEQVIYAGRFSGRKRIKQHFYPSDKHKQKINEYIQEHENRIESIIFCEFDDISDNDLNQLEKETIKLFKLNRYKYPNSHIFNFTDGGEGMSGYVPSEETKKKLSEASIGEKNHFYGRKHSDESKKKMSDAHTGKKLSKEHRKKISKSNKGRRVSEETRKKLSEIQMGEKNHMWGKYGEKNPNYGNPSNYKHSEETIEKLKISHLKDYPRIVRNGKYKGKQRYSIKFQGKVYSSSMDKKRLYEKWYFEHPDIELIDETT